MTKLETYLQGHTIDELRGLLDSDELVPAAAAGQGGLLLSRGDEREMHWSHFRRRLAILRELQVPILIVAPDFTREPSGEDYGRAAAVLGEAAELAGDFGVRIALEFHKSSGFCASLDTALALIAQCGSNHAGVCLDLFHYYTGPSKFEDLAYLSRDNLAWVQFCDLAAPPASWPATATGSCRVKEISRSARFSITSAASAMTDTSRWKCPTRGSGRFPPTGWPTWAIGRSAALWDDGTGTVGNLGRDLSVSTVASMRPAATVFREEQYFDWRVYTLFAASSWWQAAASSG